MEVVLAYIRDAVSILLCITACVFAAVGVIGMFRFPDAYTRLQASSLAGTTAPFTLFMAALVSAPDWASAGRIVLIIMFYFISCPTLTHIIARFTWHSGQDPWAPPKTMRKDFLHEQNTEEDTES